MNDVVCCGAEGGRNAETGNAQKKKQDLRETVKKSCKLDNEQLTTNLHKCQTIKKGYVRVKNIIQKIREARKKRETPSKWAETATKGKKSQKTCKILGKKRCRKKDGRNV